MASSKAKIILRPRELKMESVRDIKLGPPMLRLETPSRQQVQPQRAIYNRETLLSPLNLTPPKEKEVFIKTQSTEEEEASLFFEEMPTSFNWTTHEDAFIIWCRANTSWDWDKIAGLLTHEKLIAAPDSESLKAVVSKASKTVKNHHKKYLAVRQGLSFDKHPAGIEMYREYFGEFYDRYAMQGRDVMVHMTFEREWEVRRNTKLNQEHLWDGIDDQRKKRKNGKMKQEYPKVKFDNLSTDQEGHLRKREDEEDEEDKEMRDLEDLKEPDGGVIVFDGQNRERNMMLAMKENLGAGTA